MCGVPYHSCDSYIARLIAYAIAQERLRCGSAEEAVCQAARDREEIRTLWLRQMIRPDGTPSLIIVVDHTGVQAEVFEAVAQAARPHFGRLPVDMIPYGTSFAAAATEGVEPFYRREA